jgi:hypothetical protein
MYMKQNVIYGVLLLLFQAVSFQGQNETAKWYFGFGYCGLDFLSTPPAAVYGTAMSAIGGVSCIADAQGNTLFYTQGDTIWNASDQVMANGASLGGNSFATQAALIMKQPGSNSLYYVFSQNGHQGNLGAPISYGLRYAIVDMSLAAGQGSVIVKQVLVDSTISVGKLAGTTHCNGQDAWILTHDLNTNHFKAYLLTASGLNTVAVVSSVGKTGIHSTQGTMKFSPNGKKIGYSGGYSFQLYDFDNITGVVSGYLDLGNNSFLAQGCEFSPDGTKFYGTAMAILGMPSRLHQWDLCAGSDNAIIASRYTYTNEVMEFGEIQLGMDGKIYVGGVFYGWGNGLAIINNPNALGVNQNLSLEVQAYFFITAADGLPNFNSRFFNPSDATPDFKIHKQINCTKVEFDLVQALPAYGCQASGNRVNGVQWDFGEPSSGAANSSALQGPVHSYSGVGSYTVRAIVSHDCRVDTLYETIQIQHLSPPVLSLSPSPSVCPGHPTELLVSGADTYSWSTGVTGASLTVSPGFTSVYAVTGTDTLTGCYASLSQTVTVLNCTGLSPRTISLEIQLFPNPVSEKLFLDIKDEPSADLRIYDQLGREIYLYQVAEPGLHEINAQFLEKGVYHYRVQTPEKQIRGTFIRQD